MWYMSSWAASYCSWFNILLTEQLVLFVSNIIKSYLKNVIKNMASVHLSVRNTGSTNRVKTEKESWLKSLFFEVLGNRLKNN